MPDTHIRTRIAPSPTGYLHIGTARTALFNMLFARRYGGTFIVRIEDTDLERSQKEFEEDIHEGLAWLGITSDEPITRQTERTALYEKSLLQLLHQKKAFYCGHTKEDLEEERNRHMQDHTVPRHICAHRDQDLESGIIRLRNDRTDTITIHDEIRGNITFRAEDMGDFSLAKNPQTPLYNFAVVVDDEDMNISHVIRGEDHISNTPRQILIQEALGYARPIYAHLPLILGTDRSKMSKRDGAVSIREYRDMGYLPEALVNFMALLGWHPEDEKELFSREELIRLFTLERVQKSGAVFDIEKLTWLNGEYIRKESPQDLARLVVPFLLSSGIVRERSPNIFETPRGMPVSYELLERVVAIEQPRMKLLRDIETTISFFFEDPVYDAELLRWKGTQDTESIRSYIAALHDIVSALAADQWTKEMLKAAIMPFADEKGRGEVLWPLRTLLSGLRASPDPFEIMSAIGKEVTLRRLENASKLLETVQFSS